MSFFFLFFSLFEKRKPNIVLHCTTLSSIVMLENTISWASVLFFPFPLSIWQWTTGKAFPSAAQTALSRNEFFFVFLFVREKETKYCSPLHHTIFNSYARKYNLFNLGPAISINQPLVLSSPIQQFSPEPSHISALAM
jgi:hypothetical protein